MVEMHFLSLHFDRIPILTLLPFWSLLFIFTIFSLYFKKTRSFSVPTVISLMEISYMVYGELKN